MCLNKCMKRLEELFELASIKGNIGIQVLDQFGGIKTYVLNDFDEPPHRVVELYTTEEEKVFKMFRYPDLECQEIKDYVMNRIKRAFNVQKMLDKGMTLEKVKEIDAGLVEDYEFKEKYFRDFNSLFEIRNLLRNKYKDFLFSKAKDIMGIKESEQKQIQAQEEVEEAKPIYKSKTVTGNVFLVVLVNLLSLFGINVSVETISTIFAMYNIIVRFFTNKPIKIK